jgi:hypothetical protein
MEKATGAGRCWASLPLYVPYAGLRTLQGAGTGSHACVASPDIATCLPRDYHVPVFCSVNFLSLSELTAFLFSYVESPHTPWHAGFANLRPS